MENLEFSDRTVYDDPLTHCPLCSNRELVVHHIISRYTPPFRTERCLHCGFIFMNPPLRKSTRATLYRKGYYTGHAEYAYYDERKAEKHSKYVWEKRVEKIRSFVKTGNVLDIGCAFGGFLKTLSRYYTPYGIDISPYAGTEAQAAFGENNIHIGTLGDHPFRRDFFSVITMIEVLEHIAEPARAVSECYELLRDGGLLVIQTANMNGLQARILGKRYQYFLPGHLSYFNKYNIEMLLEKTGFSKIKFFHPVEFGLLPKLLKSRYNFTSILDYRKWFRITLYHLLSKIRYRAFALTSSMVVYAIK